MVGTAFGSEGNLVLGKYEGYEPLAMKIAEFFKSGVIASGCDGNSWRIYAFMQAADESKRRGGEAVYYWPFDVRMRERRLENGDERVRRMRAPIGIWRRIRD